ncbi:LysR family transcriptional regulator [Bordetella trematum]|nr:LysR family transcriptional regulator [Bordetella trematum]NNH18275.1 LysR family transcriptional regulator [Bordetella trematum]QIM70137.1 LysR family transcriptional regulator [Bordetella trematum]
MRRFSIPQMEALLAIARLGSFQAAAEHLNVTQPTVSLRIRELEAALGVALFEREGRRAALTAEGVLARRYAEQAIGVLDELETRLRTGDPLQGTLRVGSSETIAMVCLPAIVQQLEQRYPRLHIELTIANSLVLSERLNTNQLDIAFLIDAGVSHHVQVEPLAWAEVAWMGQAPRGRLRAADLAAQKLFVVPAPSPLHEVVSAWYAQERAPLPEFNTCTSVAIIAGMVAAGVGISALPVSVMADALASGRVQRYEQERPFTPLRLCAAYPRVAEMAGLDAVLRIARQVLGEQPYFSLSAS